MALKRDVVKYIRDKAKSNYKIDTECYICSHCENLQFHHYYSISELVHDWVNLYSVDPDKVLDWRQQFIEEHSIELYKTTVTLCESCHSKLHRVYGVAPKLNTAEKQMRWVERQKEKNV